METTTASLQPRRSASGAVDIDHYLTQARQLRAEALREAARDLVSGLMQLTHKVQSALRAYRQRRSAYRELAALDNQALHDIGIARADIDAIASGRFNDDRSRCRRHPVLTLVESAPTVPWLERDRPGIRRPALSVCTE